MLRALLLVAAAASAAKPKNQLFRPAGPRGPRRPHPPLRPISAAPASTAAPRPEVETVVDDDDFRRPAVDGRRYRLVRLRNGLEAVLVSDADADEAGAALSVRAGSFDDTLMGLAHFHEHMLFLGTEKYPGEDEYEKYLSANGGMANAWTADEETCYYFNVNADALDGAVDRLAQFFIAPTLDRDAVEREVRAVDSEYRMALQDDAWRLHSVLKATADRAHPFSRFSTGTRDTLLTEAGGVDALLGELRGWNRRRYVAPAMRLAVVGRESLDALEKLVTAPGRFGDVPAGDRDVTTLAPAWSTGETSARVKVAPVRELRSVQLMFALPSKETLRAHGVDGANPEVLVSHVLGHEGEASLHSLLRERGWIDALQCGSAVSNSGGQLFELAVDLTEAGDERCEDVIDLCFEWMGVAKRGAEAQWARLNEELRLLGETRFDFSEKRGAADTAADVADALWDHPISPLAGPLVGGYDPKATRAVLDALTPENCLVFDVRASHRPDESWVKETWHGASYTNEPLSDVDAARWRRRLKETAADLALPAKNAFIADAHAVKPDDGRAGVARLADAPPATTVWRRADLARAAEATPRVPKVVAIALFRFSNKQNAGAVARLRSFCGALMQSLNHEAYDCQLAGLSFSVDAAQRGVELRVSGFDAKAADAFAMLAERVRAAIASDKSAGFDDSEAGALAFAAEAEDLARRCLDSTRDDPARLAAGWARRALDADPEALDVDSLGEAAAGLAGGDVAKAAAELGAAMASSELEVYVAGNVDDEWALDFAKTARDVAPPDDAIPRPPDVAVALPAGETILDLQALKSDDAPRTRFVVAGEAESADEDPNAAVEVVWQIGRNGDDDAARADGWRDADHRDAAATLLSRLAQASAFNQLRTIEQLGYLVDAGLDVACGVMSLRCGVQTATGLGPVELEARVDAWAEGFRNEVAAFSDEAFDEKKLGLATELLQRPKALSDVVGRDWHEISTGRRKFSHVERRAATLRDVAKEDILKLLDDHVVAGAEKRRALRARLHAAGAAGGAADEGALRSRDDIAAFKRSRGAWPPPREWDEGKVGEPAD